MADSKIVDTKIPITWLISTAIGLFGSFSVLLWSVASQSNKIDQILNAQTKIDARLDNRDARIDALASGMGSAISAIQRVDDKQDLRIDNLERVTGLRIPIRK